MFFGGRYIRTANIVYVVVWARAMIAFVSFVEHNQVITHHFGGKFFITLLVFPAAGAKTAFNVYEATLVEVFFGQFCETSP